MSETHSCVSYLSKLMKTIVGTTAFERAQNAIEEQANFRQNRKTKSAMEDPQTVLGTLEEYFQDCFEGLKHKTKKQFEDFSAYY